MEIKEIQQALSEAVNSNEIAYLCKDKNKVLYFDLVDGTDIVYNFENSIERIRNSIYCNKKFLHRYSINLDKIAEVLFKLMPQEAFWTMRNIFFIYQISDFKKCSNIIYKKEFGDLFDAMDIDKFWTDNVGLFCFDAKSVFVNLRLIEKISKQEMQKYGNAEVEKMINDGIYVTLFHELRHLMLDSNPYLDETEYPIELSSEENVENFARNIYSNLKRSEIDYFIHKKTIVL